MSNEQSKVVTKVIDVRHKAPDQAIHELMQAAKDGFAVTKIATRFNHTHVYLETSTKQVCEASTKQVSTPDDSVDQKTFNETVDKLVEKELVDKEVGEKAKAETAKPVAKKTTSKNTSTKQVEQGEKDV